MILSTFSSYGANISPNSNALHGDFNASDPVSSFVIVVTKTASSRILVMSASISYKRVRRLGMPPTSTKGDLLEENMDLFLLHQW